MNPADFFELSVLNRRRMMDVLLKTHPDAIDALFSYRNFSGNTVLHNICEQGDYEAFDLVVTPYSGKVVSKIMNHNDETPCDIAVRMDHTEMARALIRNVDVSDHHIEYTFSRGRWDLLDDMMTAILEKSVVGRQMTRNGRCVLCSSIDIAVAYKCARALDVLLTAHHTLGIYKEYNENFDHSPDMSRILGQCLVNCRLFTMKKRRVNGEVDILLSNEGTTRENVTKNREMIRACVEVLLKHGANPFVNVSVTGNRGRVSPFFLSMRDELGPSPPEWQLPRGYEWGWAEKTGERYLDFDLPFLLINAQREEKREVDEEEKECEECGEGEECDVLTDAWSAKRVDVFYYVASIYCNDVDALFETILKGAYSDDYLEYIDILILAGANIFRLSKGEEEVYKFAKYRYRQFAKHVFSFHQRVSLFDIVKFRSQRFH